MNVEIKISTDKNTAAPLLQYLQAALTTERLVHEIGPRATRMVQLHLQNNGSNKKGWPTTRFWPRAAEATTLQESSGFALISINQVGVRQRFNGGPIRPVNAQCLTIPACAEAYGKRARDFGNLTFAFVQDSQGSGSGKSCGALVEAKSSTVSKKADVVFWLVKRVEQKADPSVLPTDNDFLSTIEQSIISVLQNPTSAI